MSHDHVQAEFEPITQPTPFADVVEVQLGYTAFNATYLGEHAQTLRDSESRQSLSGITYETPIADNVENFLRMSLPAQRLVLEYTGGHLTYDQDRDKTVSPDEVASEFRELPIHSAAADTYVKSIGTAAQEETIVTNTSEAFAQELLRYPLAKGYIVHRAHNGDLMMLHRYQYTERSTQTAHDDIGLLVCDRFRLDRKFAFDVARPAGGNPDSISIQPGYGSTLRFRQDSQQEWRLSSTTAPYDEPIYTFERMQEVAWAITRYEPDVRRGYELVRNSVTSITENALEIFERESRKHTLTSTHTVLDGKTYTAEASAYNKPHNLYVINIAEGQTLSGTRYGRENIHVELDPSTNILQITAHTGSSEETTALTITYHKENGKILIDGVSCGAEHHDYASILHTEQLVQVERIIGNVAKEYPDTLLGKLRRVGSSILNRLQGKRTASASR